jgi:putative ABC transport system permease protein
MVIWVEPTPPGGPALQAGEVALGSLLASSLGVEAGQTVEVLGEPFRVTTVLPSRADADDTAAFVSSAASPDRVDASVHPTELRLYLHRNANLASLAAEIETSVAGISVLRPDRGAVVESEAQDALASHRHLVWWITGILSLACLAIASHLDAQERRREVAMLVAIGAAGYDITLAGVLRSAALGAAGGAVGFALGAFATIALDANAASSVLPALPLAASAIAAATLVGVAAALPTGAAAALRDPVAELQDV